MKIGVRKMKNKLKKVALVLLSIFVVGTFGINSASADSSLPNDSADQTKNTLVVDTNLKGSKASESTHNISSYFNSFAYVPASSGAYIPNINWGGVGIAAAGGAVTGAGISVWRHAHKSSTVHRTQNKPSNKVMRRIKKKLI